VYTALASKYQLHNYMHACVHVPHVLLAATCVYIYIYICSQKMPDIYDQEKDNLN
jgi:hypothetical protein